MDYKHFGPFKVLECVGLLAYHLDLPALLSRIHPVFHVSLLSPVSPNEFDGRVSLPPPPILVDKGEDLEYEVEDILDVHKIRNCFKYLVSVNG